MRAEYSRLTIAAAHLPARRLPATAAESHALAGDLHRCPNEHKRQQHWHKRPQGSNARAMVGGIRARSASKYVRWLVAIHAECNPALGRPGAHVWRPLFL